MIRIIMAVSILYLPTLSWAAEGFFGFNLGYEKVGLNRFRGHVPIGIDAGAKNSDYWGYAIQFKSGSEAPIEDTTVSHTTLGLAFEAYPLTELKDFYVGPNIGLMFEVFEFQAQKASELEPYVGCQAGWTYPFNERFSTGAEIRFHRILGDPLSYNLIAALAMIRIRY